jgi:hypothetical protein
MIDQEYSELVANDRCIEDVQSSVAPNGEWVFKQCSKRKAKGSLWCTQHGKLHKV